MKTLRAVNTIVMTIKPGKNGDKVKGILPVRPETATILPKTRFKAQSEEQEAELLAQGAAVVAEDPKADAVVDVGSKSKKNAAKKADEGDTGGEGGGEGDTGGEGGGEGDGSELV